MQECWSADHNSRKIKLLENSTRTGERKNKSVNNSNKDPPNIDPNTSVANISNEDGNPPHVNNERNSELTHHLEGVEPPYSNTSVHNEGKTHINGYRHVVPTNNDKYDARSMNSKFLKNTQHEEDILMRKLLLKEALLWCRAMMLMYLM